MTGISDGKYLHKQTDIAVFVELNRKETEDLLLTADAFSSESTLEMGLSLYPQFYRIYGAHQLTFDGAGDKLQEQLRGCPHPDAPEGGKVTVILEMTGAVAIQQIDAVRARADEIYGTDRIARFVTACYYSDEFPARITLLFHAEKPRRRYFSSIHREYSFLKETEHRIARKLDEELRRNEEVGTVVAIEEAVVADLMFNHHLLWTGIANSNTSIGEVIDKLRPELERTMDEYDVSGMMLFLEVDKAFTREGEIGELVNELRRIVGGQETDMGLNIRTRDSHIKYITCRAALIGNPKYINGEVHEDFGQLEILLYVSDDEKKGHEILASYNDGKLTLSRYDWGAYEYNRMGQTDDHHFFDKENTDKLFSALHVKKPRALLRTIRRRFASRFPSLADHEFLGFCRNKGICFDSDYHY